MKLSDDELTCEGLTEEGPCKETATSRFRMCPVCLGNALVELYDYWQRETHD